VPDSTLLRQSALFVRERVGFLRFASAYDLLDPLSQQAVGVVLERPWWPWLRLVVNKRFLPTAADVLEADQVTVAFRLRRPFGVFRLRFEVLGPDGRLLGVIRNKLLSLRGKLLVEDAEGRSIAEYTGGVFSWTRELKDPQGAVLGTVDKKWAGLAKEFLTSADNYHLSLAPSVAGDTRKAALLLAACIAYDMCYKE
jgi:uncharacterized protein YxjI